MPHSLHQSEAVDWGTPTATAAAVADIPASTSALNSSRTRRAHATPRTTNHTLYQSRTFKERCTDHQKPPILGRFFSTYDKSAGAEGETALDNSPTTSGPEA